MTYTREINLGNRIAVIDRKETAERLGNDLKIMKHLAGIYKDYVTKAGEHAESDLYGKCLVIAREAVKEELAIWNEFDVIASRLISHLEE